MAEDLLKKGIELLNQATAYDAAGKVPQAISTYLLALEVLIKVHGYEKLDKNRALLKDKIQQYMSRVEVLRGLPPGATAQPNPGPAASAPALDLSDELPSVPKDIVLPQAPHGHAGRMQSSTPHLETPKKHILEERNIVIKQDSVGISFDGMFREYLVGAVRITIEDPYLKTTHQLRNLLRLLELIVSVNDAYEVLLVTKNDGAEQDVALSEMKQSLREAGISLSWKFSETLHDRCIRLSNGWKIVLGRGLDIWQKPPSNAGKYFIGASDMSLRKTLECEIHILKATDE